MKVHCHSAVAQIFNLPYRRFLSCISRFIREPSPLAAPADCKSPIQQVANLRYTPAHGFSLIELMVVLLLIGIMTALIVPEMKGTYGDAVLRSSARKLIEAINLANSRAITLNQLHQVRLERKPGRYVVERKGQQGERTFVAVRDVSGAQGEIDSRISVNLHKTTEEQSLSTDEGQSAYDDMREYQSQDAIAFYPDGTADPAEIVLRNRDGFRLYLRINPVTARVDLIDLERQ